MQIGEVLRGIAGVRKGRDGYKAKCPVHDDSHASLSVAEDNGRILIKCFAGCRTEAIMDKLGLRWKDLFDEQLKKPSRSSLGEVKDRRSATGSHDGVSYFPSSNTPRVHCVYKYHDGLGKLVYENVRYHPKAFRSRRYDADGNMIWNLEGVKRVPYRLPELMDAASKGTDIFLCEGEKDADALNELNFAATSFKNWDEAMNHYIEGRHVIIVMDHDVPGLTLATEAGRILIRSAASVRMLDMWNAAAASAKRVQPSAQEAMLPEKNGQDISDYIRHCVETEGLDRDEIKERICLAVDGLETWKDPVKPRTEEYFVVRSGNAWISQAKEERTPQMLFGEFWFEEEICILFADTNVGKSILAVQIADQISRGMKAEGGGMNRESGSESHPSSLNPHPSSTVPAQKVVYFDFELTAKQFESRFSQRAEASDKYINHYQFHPNFYRAEINPETNDMGEHIKFEDFLNTSLEQTIVATGAKVIIIDNLTYLRDETENARNALPLMKYLKKLKTKHGLSLLALAHTPKRDSTKPLGRNDLQGSKMLINFCDSSFAIGESSRQPGVRYLKQIKARNTEIVYHTENVLLATVSKVSNFLGFHFAETANENDHLKMLTHKQRDELKDQVKQLSAEGLSHRKIAEKLNISAMSVTRYLKA